MTDQSKRCWDWILVPGNCHYAKNRSMFASYRRAPGKINGRRILGVGTVELRVRRAPDDTRTNTLVLPEVLHMPNAPYNGLSVDKYRDANPDEEVEEEGAGSDGEGEGEGVRTRALSCDDGDRGFREGLWYGLEGSGSRSRVVLAGEDGDIGADVGDGEERKLGVEASEEELETLWRRVRERAWTF